MKFNYKIYCITLGLNCATDDWSEPVSLDFRCWNWNDLSLLQKLGADGRREAAGAEYAEAEVYLN